MGKEGVNKDKSVVFEQTQDITNSVDKIIETLRTSTRNKKTKHHR
jgi:hypothetical protein